MEFHLPFFALRKAPQIANPSPPQGNGRRLREAYEFILLNRDKTGPEGQETYHLYKAEISCAVHGFDEWHWIAYAFEDTLHDLDNDDRVDDNGASDADGGTFCQQINEDPIARGLDADKPIWRPRQYFLKAFEIQIQTVLDEWDGLVHTLEVDRSEYVGVPALGLQPRLNIKILLLTP